MDRLVRTSQQFAKKVERLAQCLMPLTSLLTVGVVGYISYVYITVYYPLQQEFVKNRGLFGYTSSVSVTVQLVIFLVWPIMIFWTLASIVFGDAGVINKKFVERLYQENNIEPQKIGIDYTMKEVIEILTENYLVKQGIMKPSNESVSGGDIEARNLLQGGGNSQSQSQSSIQIQRLSVQQLDHNVSEGQEIELNEIENKPSEESANSERTDATGQLNRSLLSQEDTVIVERQRLIEDALRAQFGEVRNFDFLKDLMVYKYCRICKQPKPPRTHHCRACGKCYMRMDHHCPWVGSCVAFKNHKLFLQFLFHTSFGCLYSALTMGVCTLQIMQSRDEELNKLQDEEASRQMLTLIMHDKQQMLLASTLSTVLFAAILLLLVTHMYFMFANQCSVEVGVLAEFNPFFLEARRDQNQGERSKGCCSNLVSVRNFEQCAGTSKLYWWLPIRAPPKYQACDGYNWQLRKYKSEEE